MTQPEYGPTPPPVATAPEVWQRWSPGWAIGAWFVPVAGVVLPALVLNSAARGRFAASAARWDPDLRPPIPSRPPTFA
jgi:hypothetical protein